MQRFTSQIRRVSAAFVLLAAATAGAAKDKKDKPAAKQPQDEITIEGHIPLSGGAVRRFLLTQHYSSFYLYAEHDGGNNVTLVDVTKAAQPKALADVVYAPNGGSASIVTVAGTAALVAANRSSQAEDDPPQTIRLMDFSDPLHPKVAREFTGVTAISRDERRGLIFLANSEGLWILHQMFAEDPEVQKAYTWHVFYDH